GPCLHARVAAGSLDREPSFERQANHSVQQRLLTKENLYKEAQVSRATMNRAHAVMAEWDAHIAAHGKTIPGEAKRDAAIAELKRRLAAKTQECTLLTKKLAAAATAIAALHHDNEALRQQLARGQATTVSPIRPRRGSENSRLR
ncbi:hypothetical protein, partial [Kitasatospora sp. NPDC093102]|uniref:hypothetical protein n=1 Tax=Kitasatospora sp. NPDC093102 TaxID=3155069 RepID=UPI00344001C6